MVEISQSRTLSLWDVFANIIPGVVLITGGVLPFLSLSGGFEALSLNVAEIALIGVFAMVTGLALQAPAYVIEEFLKKTAKSKRKSVILNRILPISFAHEFNRLKNSECSTPLEENFWNYCENEFELPSEFGDKREWAQLRKLLLTYLESSPYTQTVRWRAMNSMGRGLLVGLGILSLYYLWLAIRETIVPVAPGMLMIGAGFSGFFAIVIFALKNWFKQQWFEYTVLEFYLDQHQKHS